MRQLILHRAKPQVHVGLAKVDRLELGMAIGHVQKMHIAKPGNIVKPLRRSGGIRLGMGSHGQAGHGACAQDLHEFACCEVHRGDLATVIDDAD